MEIGTAFSSCKKQKSHFWCKCEFKLLLLCCAELGSDTSVVCIAKLYHEMLSSGKLRNFKCINHERGESDIAMSVSTKNCFEVIDKNTEYFAHLTAEGQGHNNFVDAVLTYLGDGFEFQEMPKKRKKNRSSQSSKRKKTETNQETDAMSILRLNALALKEQIDAQKSNLVILAKMLKGAEEDMEKMRKCMDNIFGACDKLEEKGDPQFRKELAVLLQKFN
jgi:23S rRNA U2552 (ribose-2'-O)-methylase RlmE/FtsJ